MKFNPSIQDQNDKGILILDIHSCDRCGNDHLAVEFKAFINPEASPFDYYSACPVTDEPLLYIKTEGVQLKKHFDRLTPELQRELVRILDHAHFDMDKLYRYMRKRLTECAPVPFPSSEALQETGVEPSSYAASILAIIEDYFHIAETHRTKGGFNV